MTDLPDPLIHPPVPKEDMPIAHAPARHGLSAACVGSSKGEGHPVGADPFAAFAEWTGDFDSADYADL